MDWMSLIKLQSDLGTARKKVVSDLCCFVGCLLCQDAYLCFTHIIPF